MSDLNSRFEQARVSYEGSRDELVRCLILKINEEVLAKCPGATEILVDERGLLVRDLTLEQAIAPYINWLAEVGSPITGMIIEQIGPQVAGFGWPVGSTPDEAAETWLKSSEGQ